MTNRAARHLQKFFGALCTSLCALASLSSSAGEGGPTTPDALGISTQFGKWPNGVVEWVYNSSDAPGGFTDDNEVLGWLNDALDHWEAVCGLTFVSTGIDDTADIDDTDDGVVVFEWDAAIGGAAGLAGPFFNTPPATLTELGHNPYLDGSLRLNPNVFGLVGGESPADISNNFRAFIDTVLHEAGHLIGLGHSDRPVSRMYANPYNSLPGLKQDDIDGCRSMYGYPNLQFPQSTYQVPATGANPFAAVHVANSTLPLIPVTSINDMTDGTLVVRWQVIGPFNQLVEAVAVDPEGFDASYGDAQVNCAMGFLCSGFFSFSTFDRFREFNGVWNVHVLVNDLRVSTIEVAVADLLPDTNDVPVTTFSFSEQPATRIVSATLDVTNDADGDTTTLIWHLPTQGPQPAEDISVYPDSSSANVDLSGEPTREVFVEVSDDSARYMEDPPNLVGPAGEGFNVLYRYVSSFLNHRPDYDGDNSSDILFRNDVTGQIAHWRMHGNTIIDRGVVATPNSLNWRIVSDGDFDGDGKSDLMWRNSATAEVYYWRMNGRQILSAASVAQPTDANWRVVGRGDYNGDGRSDLMWRHQLTGVVHLWLMNGATIIGSTQVATVGDFAWQIVGDEDSNADGLADLTWFNTTTGQVYLWTLNGATITSATLVAVVSDLNWQVISDGDFSGDGFSDLLWRHGVDGKVYYWQMAGPTILLSSRVSIVSDLNWQFRGSGDYNGDGFADALWVHATSGEIYQWQQLAFITLRGAQLGFLTNLDWDVVNVN